uniref:Peptidyl-prolyl cis-trans isomerase-like 4 n=1 Tax=Lygus hesperus TaxID=30085 RepID=A0A0A9YJL0_LYGHE
MYENLCRMTVELSRTPRGLGGMGGASREVRRGERGPPHAFNDDGHPSLFIGLGPNGPRIPDHVIRQKLEDAVPILAFRRHGQCAFVDVRDRDDAEKLIREVNNIYIDDARLSVQYSRDGRGKRERSPYRGETRGRYGDRERRRGNYNDNEEGGHPNNYYNGNTNYSNGGGGSSRGMVGRRGARDAPPFPDDYRRDRGGAPGNRYDETMIRGGAGSRYDNYYKGPLQANTARHRAELRRSHSHSRSRSHSG